MIIHRTKNIIKKNVMNVEKSDQQICKISARIVPKVKVLPFARLWKSDETPPKIQSPSAGPKSKLPKCSHLMFLKT